MCTLTKFIANTEASLCRWIFIHYHQTYGCLRLQKGVLRSLEPDPSHCMKKVLQCGIQLKMICVTILVTFDYL